MATKTFEDIWDMDWLVPIPVEFIDEYLERLYGMNLPRTKLIELIPRPYLSKKLGELGRAIDRTAYEVNNIIEQLLKRSKSPVLESPALENYINSWREIRMVPTKYITCAILLKVAVLEPYAGGIYLNDYQLTAEEHAEIFSVIDHTGDIVRAYKYLTCEEIVQYLTGRKVIAIDNFPIKYINKDIIDIFKSADRIEGYRQHSSKRVNELVCGEKKLHNHFYYSPVVKTATSVRLTMPEIISGLPKSLARLKDLSDPALLDAILACNYTLLFTKSRAAFIDPARFNKWVTHYYAGKAVGLGWVPDEYLTDVFINRYFSYRHNSVPDNIINAVSVEYIRDNVDRLPGLRKMRWPAYVFSELGWDPSAHYTDETLLHLSARRKKSARSAM
jgi:hypothetical protein